MLIVVIAAIAIVWATVGVLVWAACASAARADAERLAPGHGVRQAGRPSPKATQALTVWESLPGMTVRDTKLRVQSAR